MKLMRRLTLMLISVLLIIAASYLALPALLEVLIRSQLQNQGFDNVELSGLEITPTKLSIASLGAADSSRTVKLRDIRLIYSLSTLLNGEADSLKVEAVEVHANPAELHGFSLPDPVLLPAVLKRLLENNPPLGSLILGSAVVYDESEAEVLGLSGGLIRDDKGVTGRFHLRDANSRRYLLDLNLLVGAQIILQLGLSDRPDEQILELRLHSQQDGRALLGSLRLNNLSLLQAQNSAGLSGNLRADFSYRAGGTPDQPEFSLSLSAADVSRGVESIEALQLDARGSLQKLKEGGVRVSFLPQSSLQLSQFKQDELSVEQINLRLPNALHVSENGVQMGADNTARLDARQLRMGDIRLDSVRLEPLNFSVTRSQCKGSASLGLPSIKLATAMIQLQTMEVDVNCPVPGQSAWSLSMSTPGISYEDKEYQLEAERCQLTLGNSRDQQLLVVDEPAELGGTVVCERSPLSGALRSDFRLNALNGVGRADFAIEDIRPDVDRPLFSSVLKNWSEPLEIVTGELQLQGCYRWWRSSAGLPRENLGVDVQMQNIGGHYEGMLFSGLEYKDSLELLPKFGSAGKAARLSIHDIDVGIAISEFSSRLMFTPSPLGALPVMQVPELQMRLFDGMLTGKQLSFDLNAANHDFELRVQNLDLAQLVALQNMDGLSASGRLDGVIPLRVTPQGVTIRDGRIFAETQGGRIQYRPSTEVDASKESVPGSDRVLQVLEDLRYDTLDVDVDYNEQGDLQMQLALTGISPGVDPHRPVHFNLNLEQNLLTLLQGLRYAEGIDRDIDRNVQKHFEQRQHELQ